MSNASPVRTDKQYELIMECRTSGLSDQQWCSEHGINVGTFYNWVKRQRKLACHEIPKATGRGHFLPSPKQDIVKLDIISESNKPGMSIACSGIDAQNSIAPIEISIGKAVIRLRNDIDAKLLDRILCSVGELS